MRSPTRSSSSTVTSQPVTARTIARVRLADEQAEAALGGEAAHHQRVADGGEVLAARGEGGLVVGAAPVEGRRVLRRRPRVVVAAAARGRRVADRQALERARRVRGQLQALDRVDEARRLGMDRLGQPPGALGQAIAEALAPRGHLDQPQHAAPVAPAERHADLARLEPAALERLADERQRDAHRDRVHPEQVAEVVGEDQRLRVRRCRASGPSAKIDSYSGILARRARELALRDRVLLAARHRALQAGGVAVVVVLLHRLAADRARLGEDLAPEVVAAERAERVDGADEERRAERRQRLRALLAAARASPRAAP